MRVLIQRVKSAHVVVEGKIVGQIDRGLVILFATTHSDKEEQIDHLVDKIINLRIFSDSNDKMNLSIKDVNGDILVVSQFTLYGDCSKGRRPSFINALEPIGAENFYKKFIQKLKNEIKKVESGIFAAHMELSLINDGPVTFMIEI